MSKPRDMRQETAERNLASILDAGERLLREGRSATISAVAEEAKVSRVTVYAHFRDRSRLLEAIVERAAGRAGRAIGAAELDSGPPVEALMRLLASSWEELARNEEMADAAAAELSADAMERSHATVRGAIRDLIARGQEEGAFRSDVRADWLVTACLALMHAAAGVARSGEVERDEAFETLSLTVVDLFTGCSS